MPFSFQQHLLTQTVCTLSILWPRRALLPHSLHLGMLPTANTKTQWERGQWQIIIPILFANTTHFKNSSSRLSGWQSQQAFCLFHYVTGLKKNTNCRQAKFILSIRNSICVIVNSCSSTALWFKVYSEANPIMQLEKSEKFWFRTDYHNALLFGFRHEWVHFVIYISKYILLYYIRHFCTQSYDFFSHVFSHNVLLSNFWMQPRAFRPILTRSVTFCRTLELLCLRNSFREINIHSAPSLTRVTVIG